MNRAFSEVLAKQVFTALNGNGRVPGPVIRHAYEKWCLHQPAQPCRYLHEHAIAIDCECQGHLEQMCYFFFDEVVKKLNSGEVAPNGEF